MLGRQTDDAAPDREKVQIDGDPRRHVGARNRRRERPSRRLRPRVVGTRSKTGAARRETGETGHGAVRLALPLDDRRRPISAERRSSKTSRSCRDPDLRRPRRTVRGPREVAQAIRRVARAPLATGIAAEPRRVAARTSRARPDGARDRARSAGLPLERVRAQSLGDEEILDRHDVWTVRSRSRRVGAIDFSREAVLMASPVTPKVPSRSSRRWVSKRPVLCRYGRRAAPAARPTLRSEAPADASRAGGTAREGRRRGSPARRRAPSPGHPRLIDHAAVPSTIRLRLQDPIENSATSRGPIVSVIAV